MQGIASGSALPDVLNRVNTLDTVLDRTLRFAFHTQLGYLTQRLDALGTGLQPSVLLFLPPCSRAGRSSSFPAMSHSSAFPCAAYLTAPSTLPAPAMS